MGKKASKEKSKEWGCSHGCDVSTKICKHLEAKMITSRHDWGKPSTKTLDEYKFIRQVLDPNVDIPGYEKQVDRLEALMTKLGLEPVRAELLMDTFVDNLSIREITKLRGYTSRSVTHNLLKNTLKKLRELDPVMLRNLIKGEMNEE